MGNERNGWPIAAGDPGYRKLTTRTRCSSNQQQVGSERPRGKAASQVEICTSLADRCTASSGIDKMTQPHSRTFACTSNIDSSAAWSSVHAMRVYCRYRFIVWRELAA